MTFESSALYYEIINRHAREQINRGIVDDSTTGKVSDSLQMMFLQAVTKIVQQGAQGLILGSTDHVFVIKQEDVGLPMLDTAKLHALGVARWALDEARG